MFDGFLPWLQDYGFSDAQAALLVTLIEAAAVVVVAVGAHYLTRHILVRQLLRLVARTRSTWDDRLTERRVFHRLSHLAPALVLHQASWTVLADYPRAMGTVQLGCDLYMLLAGAWVVSSLFKALEDIVTDQPVGRIRRCAASSRSPRLSCSV